MKKLVIVAPAILSLLTIAIAPKANAEPMVYESPEGPGVLIDNCFVQFDHNGTLTSANPNCDDVQIHDAKEAVKNYLNQNSGSNQNSNGSGVYRISNGFAIDIGDCHAEFNNNGSLRKGGQMCDDVELYQAKEAVADYLRELR